MRLDKSLGVYGFIVRAFTRVQTFTVGEYTVEVERIIESNYVGFDAGRIFTASIKLGDSKFEGAKVYTYGNKVYTIVEKKNNEGKVESVEYYVTTYAEESIDAGDGEKTKVALYTGATVSKLVANRYETSDGISYVDIETTGGVVMLVIEATPYIVNDCTYDEATKTYTVNASSGKKFTVQVAETGSVIITDITANA